MGTLQTIIAELERQQKREGSSFRVVSAVMGPRKADSPKQVSVTGWIDLEALAAAVDRARRIPGLPADTSAIAIGYSAYGQPFILRFDPKVGAWEGISIDPDGTGCIRYAVGNNVGLIAEHEIVKVKR